MTEKFRYLTLVISFTLIITKSFGAVFFGDSFPPPLSVGVSIPLSKITLQEMKYAKSVGISCLQVSVGEWLDPKGNFKLDENKIRKEVEDAKQALQDAGITVAAIHMPYGQFIDLSLCDEALRRKVVATHKKIIDFCKMLTPNVILFHPSWFLTLNQRKEHIQQLIKSVNELKNSVDDIGAIMVIENMTGPELYVKYKGIQYERPLGRTVEEMKEIFNLLPKDVYAAVDMNHILYPERMVTALGSRLKFIHVSDGDGAHEFHYYPCSGKGMNNWISIIDALYKAGYKGPFMFECHYNDLKDLSPCYAFYYNQFIIEKYIQPKYR